MKMIDIKDIGVKYVLLSSGKYLIGNEVVNVEGYGNKRVQIKEGDEVKAITETSVITKYIKGEEEMSVDEYNEIKNRLLEKQHWDEYDCLVWEDLESEYEYKKLTTYWQPIYKTIQEFSDPLKVVEIKEINYKTNNEYIQSLFFNGDKNGDITLYVYDRPRARIDIVTKIFKELGFEYESNISYARTEGKKVWSNSSHSVIRYVTAFGTYVFNDSWGSEFTPRGTLEDMKKMYEEDYNAIKKIIMTHYNRTFGKINKDEFDFIKLIDNLNSLRSSVSQIDSKVKTREYQYRAINRLDKMIEEINRMFK